jgi:hypothetical protein
MFLEEVVGFGKKSQDSKNPSMTIPLCGKHDSYVEALYNASSVCADTGNTVSVIPYVCR